MTETRKQTQPRRPGSDSANDQIASKLRQFYDGVREEEIPERFLDLLEKLDEAERAAKGETDGEATKNERK